MDPIVLPTSMRSCRYHGKRKDFTIETMPLPLIGPSDALVEVVASGVCRSDWHLWNGDWSWLGFQLPEHTTLGHEIGGLVARVGEGVRRVEPGLRVTIPCNLACGHCDYCRQGEQNICDNQTIPFLVEGGGGWQKFVRVPDADVNCITLPDGVDELTAAALGCRYMTAWRAVTERASVRAGEFVAVHGCGGVGLAVIQISATMGGRTIAVDIDDKKLDLARQNGAVAAVNATGLTPADVGAAVKQLAGGIGAHAAIDALGGSKTSIAALLSLRKGGRLAQVGLTGASDKGLINIPMDLVVLQELSICGSQGNPHSAYPQLLGMVAAGRLDPKSLISRTIGLDEVQSVLQDMDDYKTAGYVVITKF